MTAPGRLRCPSHFASLLVALESHRTILPPPVGAKTVSVFPPPLTLPDDKGCREPLPAGRHSFTVAGTGSGPTWPFLALTAHPATPPCLHL